MSAIVSIKPGQLAATIRAAGRRNQTAIKRGIRAGAARGVGLLTRLTPVDEGVMKSAWKVVSGDAGTRIENLAPHAGIIEAGARPHPVSEEGRKAIEGWVRRVVLSSYTTQGGAKATGKVRKLNSWEKANADVRAIVERIIWKIRTKGAKGHWIVKGSMEELRAFVFEEIERFMAKAHGGGGQ
jgi:hypothetical protein